MDEVINQSVEEKWPEVQDEYGLRDKDQERIAEAIQVNVTYGKEHPDRSDPLFQSDYEVVSHLCIMRGWHMNGQQWLNFIGCVRDVIRYMKSMGRL